MQRRILALVIAMTSATLIALLVPAAFALHASKRTELEHELLNEAFEYGHRYDSTHIVGTMAKHQIAVYSRDGTLVEGDGPRSAGTATNRALADNPAVVREGDRMVAAVPLNGGGALRVAEASHESDLKALETLARLSAVALVTITIAVFIAFRLTRRINRPLAALATTARRLGGGDFTVRPKMSGLAEIDDVSTALMSAAERLAHVIARERRLTNETSHQLRTPLAGMRIAIEAERASPRDDSSTLMDELLAAIDRMDNAIADLIALGRTVDRDGSTVSVIELVRRAAERWEHSYRIAGRTMRTKVTAGVGPKDIQTIARSAAIDTVLDVLLDNALVHGTGTVCVRLEFVLVAPIIWVEDEGVFSGDDPMAQPYEMTHTRGQHGLGLRIAHALADAEGARVRLIKRTPTTFELILPAAGA